MNNSSVISALTSTVNAGGVDDEDRPFENICPQEAKGWFMSGRWRDEINTASCRCGTVALFVDPSPDYALQTCNICRW